MTNTHINVGGHKVTTNKVGTVHKITSLKTGFTTTNGVTWIVSNGICFITLDQIVGASTGNAQACCDSIPTPKIGIWCSLYSNRGDAYVQANVGTLYINVLTANSNLNGTLVYPVADDWVES